MFFLEINKIFLSSHSLKPLPEVYSQLSLTSTMEPFTIFAESSIVDVQLGSDYDW